MVLIISNYRSPNSITANLFFWPKWNESFFNICYQNFTFLCQEAACHLPPGTTKRFHKLSHYPSGHLEHIYQFGVHGLKSFLSFISSRNKKNFHKLSHDPSGHLEHIYQFGVHDLNRSMPFLSGRNKYLEKYFLLLLGIFIFCPRRLLTLHT